MKMYLNGNTAVAHAVRLVKPGVVAAYPITPQTVIVEKIADFIANGELDAQYIKVESEHTAMAACYGASAAGARAFTATSSQGLAYMQEMLNYVSGVRVPVVMVVGNRALSGPWTIWLDHQDTIQARDTGWIQLYVENSQEALDTIIQAYKIAENPEILTPVMVCMDAFVLTHTEEVVDVPEAKAIDAFLPPYNPEFVLDANNPLTFSFGTPPALYMEFRVLQEQAMQRALGIIKEVAEDYGRTIGRYWPGLIEKYGPEDAEVVVVAMGSLCGTIKEVVDDLNYRGKKVALVRIRAYRPFPVTDICQALQGAKAVGVFDRDLSFGYAGALYTDVKAALYGNLNPAPRVLNYVGGLGGRDVRVEEIESIFLNLLGEQHMYQQEQSDVRFVGVRW
ncbi:Thiamin diphosphate-binding fold [Moorella glycerini]|uniref:NADH-dependent phenylglyoxylate dehydrogenase subunit alpha n=1 Tax=Neomoorella stamsii TaxID=1266720 RepID=A0A9X7P7E8_9FIRM|nr:MULTISPECIES: pyruvate ferredoxin oxidoreductase [Moorella]PRR77113.1 NADH-dependent phenylglyoxylate dehydrogenase subunit alpha [Moorella stamsii]CEP66862.1 Thiamin diphosphate-binding fold [Moorella glycerini]